MHAFLRLAFIALVAMTSVGATEAMARPRDPYFTDLTRPNGGYPPNSPQGQRAFWDYQDRWNR